MRAVRLVSAGVDDVAGRPVRPAELAGAERDAVGGRELEMRHAMTLHTEDYCPGAASVATPNVSSTQTVILPVVTETIKDETVERPAVTVTLAGTTTTVAAGASTTVVTVTGPEQGRP